MDLAIAYREGIMSPLNPLSPFAHSPFRSRSIGGVEDGHACNHGPLGLYKGVKGVQPRGSPKQP